MLCEIVFRLSGKVATLHLDNSTAKAYSCNQGGTPSTFFSKLACHILNLADMYGINLLPAYFPIHLNVITDYLSQGRLVSELHLLPHIAEAIFQLLKFWNFWRWICVHPYIPVKVRIITPMKSTTSRSFLILQCILSDSLHGCIWTSILPLSFGW